jgi:dTDP-6-deoxy-L-talose 4-dehydrogenase (NAD+)
MQFLITGATGFIGRQVVARAAALGHELIIYKRGEKIKANGCTKAIHLAWADVQNYMDEGNFAENLQTQKDILNQIIDSGITDITVTGTCLEYGLTSGACTEDMVAISLPTTYARAKLELYNNFKHLPNLKWLRCFYVYGVGGRPKSLLMQLLKAIEDGKREFNMSMGDQVRDFINVETLAHNIWAIAAQNQVNGIINAGSGKPTTVLEFIESILAIKGYKMQLNKGFYPYANYEPMEFWADITKLKSISGTKFDDKIWI